MAEVRIDEGLECAVSWTVVEAMERGSHALITDGRAWLIDPVADDDALAAVERRGDVAGVIQLLDRHPRDCEELARRYGVEHLRLPATVPGAPFEIREMLDVTRWRELAIWWEAERLAVVAESVGTAAYFAVGESPVGIHPFLRLKPPGALGRLAPERLLVGHGPPLHAGAEAALREAISHSRRDIPRLGLTLARAALAGGRPRG